MKKYFVVLALSVIAIMGVGGDGQAQPLEETTQILVNWTPESGHIFKVSFKEPVRYDAYKIQFGDGQEVLIADPSTPATHFYREAGDYVVVVTIYFPTQAPIQIQKGISVTPLGSPVDSTIAQAKRFALEIGAAILAIFLILREIGIIA